VERERRRQVAVHCSVALQRVAQQLLRVITGKVCLSIALAALG
jgi:hypothetical protein